jgi:anti-sigma-K factor RskA
MSELDDIELLAGEYVLGTLSAGERADVARRRVHEAQLDAAIVAWEARLAPMLAEVAPVAPDAHLFERIREQIGSVSTLISLRSRQASGNAVSRPGSNGWRSAALAFGAMAAALAGVIGWREAERPEMPATYVAVLQAGKDAPAFLMTVDTKAQMFAVRALTPPAEADKDYELWLVNDKLAKPMSLGMVAGDSAHVRPLEHPGIDQGLFMDATFAVSLEPKGGSPTGSPTGPVLFSGKLHKSTP